jgi:hypothetical protein
MTASMRRRAYTRAAHAWQAGKPHTAWEILTSYGLQDEWPVFQRVALRIARGRYLRRMPPSH